MLEKIEGLVVGMITAYGSEKKIVKHELEQPEPVYTLSLRKNDFDSKEETCHSSCDSSHGSGFGNIKVL